MICECGCGRQTPIATRTDRRVGVIKGQPHRYVRGHSGGRKSEWSDEAILDAIRSWVSETGLRPFRPAWNAAGGQPSSTTIIRRFGSWRKALTAAGIDLPRPRGGAYAHWTPDRIYDAMRDWAFRHGGEAPACTDWAIANEDYPSVSTVFKKCGSWNRAISRAGLAPRLKGVTRMAKRGESGRRNLRNRQMVTGGQVSANGLGSTVWSKP